MVWFGVFLFTLLAGYVMVGFLFAHTVRAKQFAQRESMTFDQIYERFLSDDAIDRERVRLLWFEIARNLRVEGDKLRPTDRLSDELKCHLPWFPLLDLNDEFASHVTSIMRKKKIPVESADSWETLGDYVRALA